MKKSSNSGHEAYERQAAMCKAFANPTRLQLIDLLGRKQRWASELQQGLGISKANLSQHLSILRTVGVVSTQREGKQLYCGISMPEVKQATAILRHMTKVASPRQSPTIMIRFDVSDAFCSRRFARGSSYTVSNASHHDPGLPGQFSPPCARGRLRPSPRLSHPALDLR